MNENKRIKKTSFGLSLLISVGILIFVIVVVYSYSWLFYKLFILSKINIGIGTDSFTDYLNVIVLLITAFIIIIYTSETKKMVDIQYDAQFHPSISLEVFTDHYRRGNIYDVVMRYTNHTKYAVDKRSNLDDAINRVPTIEEPYIYEGNSLKFLLPPNTTIEHAFSLEHNNLKQYLEENRLTMYNNILVDTNRSPYIMGVGYKANNGYFEVDFTKELAYYNLKFYSDEKVKLEAEIYNSFIKFFTNTDPTFQNDFIYRFMSEACDFAKQHQTVPLNELKPPRRR
jgi:hypothetical protein